MTRTGVWWRRIAVSVAVALMALLGFAGPGYAEPVPTPAPAEIYTHDGGPTCAALTAGGSERGPLVTRDEITYDAVGLWSRGASACSEEPTPHGVITYDAHAPLVLVASATATTQVPDQVAKGGLAVPNPAGVAAKFVTRSLDDFASLRGASPAEIENLIPSNWVKSATNVNKGGLGVRYSNPERLGEQIRVMPGKATDPNPVKQGPYLRISRNGTVTDPIPLEGNPTWP